MNFATHSNLKGMHAFMSASNYHWLNYDKDKLITVYDNFNAANQGTVLHDFARQCIELGQRLPDYDITLNMYVNDAISFGLNPEVVLYYSDFCFGTADAINYKNGMLRIHDLKTGVTPAKMDQLYIYAALFFLEYGIKPEETQIETRIYQNDIVTIENPTGSDIKQIMTKIIEFDKILRNHVRENRE